MANPIVALLSRTVLTGENFQKWKSDLDIVLISENIRFILIDPCPLVPATNTQRAVRENCDRWTNANNRAITYMLTSMSDTLRSKMKMKVTAVEIIEAVHEIFGKQREQACIELARKYTSTKMKARTSVRDHVMMMTNYFTDAEFHGAQIDEVTQVGIILNSLSHDFIQFTFQLYYE